ncbi:unnamed protein product [Lymnaea stagnalis]|uniref:THD domain-containing protein n=1 Tax=Lymnaea stagnalis TaxID=6523 RepID=A0AAV2I7G6_LYMST
MPVSKEIDTFKGCAKAMLACDPDVTGRGSYDQETVSTTAVNLHRRIYICLLLTFALCVVTLVISVVALTTTRKDVTLPEAPLSVCVECNKLIKNPYDLSERDLLLESLERKTEDGVTKCCASNSQQLSALIEISLRKQQTNKEPLPAYNVSDFKFSPASAHKRLYPPQSPFPEVNYRDRVPRFDNGTVYVLFKHDKSAPDPLVEHDRGVEVLNDGLRIVYSGLYYVYSSIHFRPESAHPCKDFQYQTWAHYVEKITPNDPAKTGCLLKTVHTCCDECTMDEETSYVGGTFELEAGDVVRILVSGHGLVYFRQQTSFAGLVMMGLANPGPGHQ